MTMEKRISNFGVAYNAQIDGAVRISKEISTYLTKAGAWISSVGAIQEKTMRHDINCFK